MSADIATWLAESGLGKYAATFAENEVDLAVVAHLSEQDLIDIGLPLGARRKLQQAVARLSVDGRAVHPAEPAPVVPPRGERRQVTVLFSDISGFTKLSSELDAEATHGMLNRFFEAVDTVVTGYGGTIDKHIGDAVMAVFGAPVAHTDDPERALRAALDIHQAVAELDPPLTVHVGIASGQVIASGTGSDAHREYTVTGDSVNLASRLTEMAAAGETLVSEAVQAAASNRFSGEALGARAIQGLPQPVTVWRLHGLVAADDGARHRFVGRDAEIAQFTGMLDACRSTGHGVSVHVRGEAGIGKTRLVEEFQRLAQSRGYRRHAGLVLDFGAGKGQDAIRAIVRSLLQIPAGSGRKVRRQAAEQAVSDGRVPVDRIAHLNDLLDLHQPPAQRSLYDAMDNRTRNRGKRDVVAELVRRTSAQGPLLLKVEDVHWADDIVLSQLARLAATVAECPALLVMTSRIEGDPLDQAWRSAAEGAAISTIDLAPLREMEALELAGDFFDTDSRYVQSCVERAGGNPLFLEQLLRSDEDSTGDALPGSVQGIVQARMDTLAPDDRAALQSASAMGQRFTLAALRHLIDDPAYQPAGLLSSYLVRPEGDDYLFSHALVCEGAYASLLTPQRRDLHRRAADWFAESDPGLKAEHLDRAEAPEAAAAYLAAAESEFERFRYERALHLAERGLGLTAEGMAAAPRYQLTCLQGDVLRELGQADKSIAAFEQALEAAPDSAAACRAWIGLAEAMRIVDRYDDGLTALVRAEAAAAGEDRQADLAHIHYLRGNYYFPLGNVEGCLAEHNKAAVCGRAAGRPEYEARAFGGLGDANYLRGRMITAGEHFDRCIDLCRRHNLRNIEVSHLYMRAATNLYRLEIDQARRDGAAAVDGAVQIGNQRAEMVAHGVMSYALWDHADLDGCEEHATAAVALARRLGAGRFEALYLSYSSRTALARGKASDSLELAETAYAIVRESSAAFAGPWVLGALARAAPDNERYQSAIEEAERLLAGESVAHNYLNFYVEAIEAALDRQAWDDIDRFADALTAFTATEPLPWSDYFIARGRALAGFGRGGRDAATIAALGRLRDDASRVGLNVALPALDRALSSIP